jgi:hypothetical protein
MTCEKIGTPLRIGELVDNLIVIVGEKEGDEFIHQCIFDFFRDDVNVLSHIEDANIPEVKDYVFCLLFNYIDSQIKIKYNKNLFEKILSYYKIWRSGEE